MSESPHLGLVHLNLNCASVKSQENSGISFLLTLIKGGGTKIMMDGLHTDCFKAR